MKKASIIKSSLEDKSINAILDMGLHQFNNNGNLNSNSNLTYALNNDILSLVHYNDTLSKNKGHNLGNTNTTIGNPFISPHGSVNSSIRSSPKRDNQLMEVIDYRQQLSQCQNELLVVKRRLNDEIYANAELRRQLESNNRLMQEKDFKIEEQMRQLSLFKDFEEEFMKLKHDYNTLVIELSNSESNRNEQHKLIMALQNDLDLQRQKSFNAIDYLNKQKGVIELNDVNTRNITNRLDGNNNIRSKSNSKSRTRSRSKSKGQGKGHVSLKNKSTAGTSKHKKKSQISS